MRLFMLLACSAVLATACTTQVPDSAAGVGFDSTPEEMRQRAINEPVAGSALPAPSAISQETLGGTPNSIELQNALAPISGQAAPGAPLSATSVPVNTGPNADIAAETAAVLSPAAAANSGVEPLQASPNNPSPVVLNNPGISDENDFGAVSARQSIESDAQRIDAQAQQRVVVAPSAVPERQGAAQPNIVTYALTTSHARGVQKYNRVGIKMAARSERNCAKYPSADQAQIAFLEQGGPERDRLVLDPDGDGYACSWDPTPFRAAVQG